MPWLRSAGAFASGAGNRLLVDQSLAGAEEAVADGVAGGVERLMEAGEEVALLGGAGLGRVDGEVRGHGVVEEQVALLCPNGPNGAMAPSPGLRGTSYPGNTDQDFHQPQRGCGLS